jgi:hypothetical protein
MTGQSLIPVRLRHGIQEYAIVVTLGPVILHDPVIDAGRTVIEDRLLPRGLAGRTAISASLYVVQFSFQ